MIKTVLLGSSMLIAGSGVISANNTVKSTDAIISQDLKMSPIKFNEEGIDKKDSNDEELMANKKEITETINTHLKGIKKGKIELIESAWLKASASVTEINKGSVTQKDINKCFSLWSNEPTKNLNEKINSIQLTSDDVAVAQVSLSWNGSTYDDTLTLIKTNDGWKIVSKIYSVPELNLEQREENISGGYGG